MAAKKAVSAKFYGTGRRKSSIARVYVTAGTGKITINKRDIDEYFGLETLKVIVRQPLVATDTCLLYTSCSKTAEDMMKVRNLGRKSLEEVLAKLKELGLELSPSEE